MSSLRLALKQSLAESAQIQLQRDVERRRMEESQRRKKERRQQKKRKEALQQQRRGHPLDKASRRAQQEHLSDQGEEEVEFSDSSAAAADVDEEHSAAGGASLSSSRQVGLSMSFDDDRSDRSSEQEMQFEVDDEGRSFDGIDRVRNGKEPALKQKRKSRDGIMNVSASKKAGSGAEDASSSAALNNTALDPADPSPLKKKKKKRRPPSTVAKPTPRVLTWVRAMSENKQRRHMKEGLRVKVQFDTGEKKKNGKKRLRWYGGLVTAVNAEGGRIRIVYDDGTSEMADFPDGDIIVDADENGKHYKSTGGSNPALNPFIPPLEEDDDVNFPVRREKHSMDSEPAMSSASNEKPLREMREKGSSNLPLSAASLAYEDVGEVRIKSKKRKNLVRMLPAPPKEEADADQQLHNSAPRIDRTSSPGSDQDQEKQDMLITQKKMKKLKLQLSAKSATPHHSSSSNDESGNFDGESEDDAPPISASKYGMESKNDSVLQDVNRTMSGDVSVDDTMPRAELSKMNQSLSSETLRIRKIDSSGASSVFRMIVPTKERLEKLSFSGLKEKRLDEGTSSDSLFPTGLESASSEPKEATQRSPSSHLLAAHEKHQEKAVDKMYQSKFENSTSSSVRKPETNSREEETSQDGTLRIAVTSKRDLMDVALANELIGISRSSPSLVPKSVEKVPRSTATSPGSRGSSKANDMAANDSFPASTFSHNEEATNNMFSSLSNEIFLGSEAAPADHLMDCVNLDKQTLSPLPSSEEQQLVSPDTVSYEVGKGGVLIARPSRDSSKKANKRLSGKEAKENPSGRSKKRSKGVDEKSHAKDADDDDDDGDDEHWVQCDRCQKWRLLPDFVDMGALPERWYCEMNKYDTRRNKCNSPEQTAAEVTEEREKAKLTPKKRRRRSQESKAASTSPEPPPDEVENAGAAVDENDLAKSLQRTQSKDNPKTPLQKHGEGETGRNVEPVDRTAEKASEKISRNNLVPLAAVYHPEGTDNADSTEQLKKLPVPLPKKNKGDTDGGNSDGETAKVKGARNRRKKEKETDKCISRPIVRGGKSKEKADDSQEWVQCEKCDKWRRLPPRIKAEDLPDVWYCSMNTWDIRSASCAAPEDKAEAGTREFTILGGADNRSGGSKLTYRNLIFGSGRKQSRPTSERARAADSIFMVPSCEHSGEVHPSVSYANSSCFVQRGLSQRTRLEEATGIALLELMSNSRLWSDLYSGTKICRPIGCYSAFPLANEVVCNGDLDAIKSADLCAGSVGTSKTSDSMKALVYHALGENILANHEILLEAQCRNWGGEAHEHWAELRAICTLDLINRVLEDLVTDGLVEEIHGCLSNEKFVDPKAVRYRRVNVPSATAINNTRCIKLAKPWKSAGNLGKRCRWSDADECEELLQQARKRFEFLQMKLGPDSIT